MGQHRSVWNQHAYHVTNVNVDGSLPFPEPNSWDPGQSNSYGRTCRTGVQLARSLRLRGGPDLTTAWRRSEGERDGLQRGATPARPGVQVDFYAELAGGSVLIGSGATKAILQAGASEKVTVPWSAPPPERVGAGGAVVDRTRRSGTATSRTTPHRARR